MNERILELAKQAGLKYSSETQLSPAEQKFAELIAQECAGLAGCNAHVSGFALGDLIEDHFRE